jgi:transcriptional regulator with XRE-family HTH domain
VATRRLELQMALLQHDDPSYVLAAQARIHPNRLSGIVNGRLSPTAAERKRLADLLDMPEEALFADDLTTTT